MAYVSKEDKAKLAPAIKSVLKKYGMKGTISVRNHMSLCVKVMQGPIDFKFVGRNYIDVNTYHIDSQFEGTARKFLNELLSAMKGPDFFNHDDPMSDYFHRSHYIDIEIGQWTKPYVLTK